jgi:flagellar hook-associated protein 1 FlgK
MSIISIGITGLNAAQAGMLTTSHNISNASTPGYSRQQIVQSTSTPISSGAGFLGQGTQVQTVTRIYSQFLGGQVLTAEAAAAQMSSYQAQISQIDNLLADPTVGLSPALTGFFNGVQTVAANPSLIPARQSMLSAGQALVGQFQALDQRLSEIRDGVNQQIAAQVTQINAYSSQLADIGQRILLAQGTGNNQPPNDLLDQRDLMLTNLNKLVRVSTVTQSDGSYNVFIGNGQPLVVGTQAYQLKAVSAADDPQRTTVGIVGASGTAQALPEAQITGGSLGGLLSFRSQTLDSTQNALGRIALTLAQNFNDQHKLGQDLTGALGGNFFNVSGPTVQAGLNTGTGVPTVTIDAATIDQLTSSDYRLASDALGILTLTRLSDNSSTTITFPPPSPPQLVDGMSIDISAWTPASGDSFLIQPTRTGAKNISVAFSDVRSIAAAAPIRTATALTNTGTAAISAGTVNAPQPILPNLPNLPNLRDTVTLTFTGAATFDVSGTGTGNPTSVSYTAGANISYNGWTTQITGNPATGDTFTISANASGVSDNRNAALLGALQTQTPMVGGTASYQAAYSQIVSAVGSKDNEVQSIGAAQQALADNATKALQSVSGVNLDEEAANLMRYQQAYQAAAKVLQMATKIFDQILALG